MSNGFREVLEIRPPANRGLHFTGLVLLPAACLAIAVADLPVVGKLIAALLTVGGVVAAQIVRGSRHSVEGAMLLPDGRWTVYLRGGAAVGGRLRRAWGGSLGWVIALEWHCEDGRSRRLWLFEQDVPGPAWRRLRVRLRMS